MRAIRRTGPIASRTSRWCWSRSRCSPSWLRRCSAILLQSLQDAQGRFVGLANFIAYAKTPALLDQLWNSVWVSALVTLITMPLAFGFAYALTRSCMPLQGRCFAASR